MIPWGTSRVMIPQVRKILLVLHVIPNWIRTCNTKSIFLTWGIILTRLVTHGNIVSVGWFLCGSRARDRPRAIITGITVLKVDLDRNVILHLETAFDVKLGTGTSMKCCYKRVNCSLWYLVPTCYMGTIGNKLVPGITVWTVWFTLLYQHFIAVPGTTVKLTLS